MVSQRTRDYELVMILSPEATEEEVASAVEKVGGLIADGGGGVTETETWGVRRLAYPVMKFQEGNYVLTRFTLDASAVAEFESSMQASAEILRFLLTKA